MSEQTEGLIKDIHDRLEALGQQSSEDQIRQIVSEALVDLMQDEDSDFSRKMRFGGNGGGERKLLGTKFARWNLTVADIEFFYDLQRASHAVGKSKGPSEELENTFKALSEAYYIPQDQIRQIDQRALDNLFPRVPVSHFPIGDQDLAMAGRWPETQAYQQAVRAMDTAESGYGSQLIGAQYVGELWQAARAESRVFSLLDTFEMTDPTAYLPVEADLPEMLFVPENTASNASAYTTSKTGSQRVTVSAKKFVIHQMWSGEMEEDSIIAFVPFIRRQALLSLAHYSDSLVLNGDTTNAGTGNINLDDADPDDEKHYLAFDGIRKAALTDNTGNATDQAASIDYDSLIDVRSLMVDPTYLMDWGHPNQDTDLVYVSDPYTGDKVAVLDETLTMDKYGPSAAVFRGQITRIGQHPFITSMAMGKTEADGKISTTSGNNTKGQIAIFNRRGFKVGWRRRVKLEVERLAARDQTRLVHSLRLGFGRYSPTGAASGIEAAVVLYNITV